MAAVVRYPVKSMRGQAVKSAMLNAHGLERDRLYAFESEAAPPGMLRVAGRERRELLRYSATLTEDAVVVKTPADRELAVTDPALLAHFPGFSRMRLTATATPQTDVRPLSLISLQTIQLLGQELGQELDARRFRANLYLDLAEPFAEDAFVGRTLRVGERAEVQILERDPRCRFITLDPETTEPLPALMTLLHRRHESRAGVYARVVQPGEVRVGDALRVI